MIHLVSHGKEFGFYLKCYGKPLENFIQGNNVIATGTGIDIDI